jgi:hypothetical protein
VNEGNSCEKAENDEKDPAEDPILWLVEFGPKGDSEDREGGYTHGCDVEISPEVSFSAVVVIVERGESAARDHD